jgi:hypothetical protein
MVTEGLPVDCTSCLEDDRSVRRPSTTSNTLGHTDSFGGMTGGGFRTSSSSEDKENGAQRAAFPSHARAQESSPAIETPPESPRVVALQTGQNVNNYRRDSSFRKTYDENDKKRAIPCENCALTLPKKREDGPSSQGPNGKMDASGPILRTRKPYERVARAVPTEELSPPKSANNSSTSSESGEFEAVAPSDPPRRSQIARVGTSSSNSSFISTVSHTHFLDYTSTHEPLAPTSFSIIRQSCLRTLSCETLPPSASPTTSPSSPFGNPFSSGPGGTSTSSGGPIFFGDPLAGYTTAYIFRIPDPNARGKRRLYALMALSTHRERLAMQTFSFLSVAFRELAAWIQGLAETELGRSENVDSPQGERSTGTNNNTPTSSFLSGRNRGYESKFAGVSLRAKGLAELVGLPDFFIELHTKFVRLLIELGLLLGQ